MGDQIIRTDHYDALLEKSIWRIEINYCIKMTLLLVVMDYRLLITIQQHEE